MPSPTHPLTHSPITHHPSPITHHPSPITNHQSPSSYQGEHHGNHHHPRQRHDGCVASVQRVLKGINGITSADVSLEQAQASITYDPAQADLQKIKAAITDAGYDVA